jgi:hypothetical protein
MELTSAKSSESTGKRAKELQKRDYRYDGGHWIKSQRLNAG